MTEEQPQQEPVGLHDPAVDQFRLPIDAIVAMMNEEPWRNEPLSSPPPESIWSVRVIG